MHELKFYLHLQDSMNENFDASKMIDFFAFFMENVYLYSQSLARKTTQCIRRFLENIQIAELVDLVNDKLSEHPILRCAVLMSAVSCALPILFFVVFGFITLIITFAGFLFVEGTLLAIGGFCTFFCLSVTVLFMSVATLAFGLFYSIICKLKNVLDKIDPSSHVMRNFRIGSELFRVSDSIDEQDDED